MLACVAEDSSGAGGEQTATDVHATLCALLTAEAAQHSAWAAIPTQYAPYISRNGS